MVVKRARPSTDQASAISSRQAEKSFRLRITLHDSKRLSCASAERIGDYRDQRAEEGRALTDLLAPGFCDPNGIARPFNRSARTSHEACKNLLRLVRRTNVTCRELPDRRRRCLGCDFAVW